MRNWIVSRGAILLIFGSYCLWPACAKSDCTTICTCPSCPFHSKEQQGRWFTLETANFQICCDGSKAPATHLARHAETWRNQLCATWLGQRSAEQWNPKCQIVLHSSRGSYGSAVGRGSERTVGSSLVTTDKGRIISRRIDLLGAGTDFLSAALPHELTHIVLGEYFASAVVPRWADEGMAVLADPVSKQKRHDRDIKQALASDSTFHIGDMLTSDYPAPSRIGVFYGQSASLTRYLVARKNPRQFVEFLKLVSETGYDAALRKCYAIEGVRDLDRQWKQSAQRGQSAPFELSVTAADQSSQTAHSPPTGALLSTHRSGE